MTGKLPLSKKRTTIDWLFQGVLTKLGDTFDRFTGRRWTPSSSLAASELIDRLKKLLDAEAKSVPGKGRVVPHNIKLRMQWDKFSEDAEASLKKLEFELLTAAIDHINDSLYYTFAPVTLEVKADYFVEGVKLVASFEEFVDEDPDVQLNVTIPQMKLDHLVPKAPAKTVREAFIARFEIKSVPKEKRLEFPSEGSLSVGRTGSNALVIDDGSVSKIHASLSINADGRLVVSDTGSTNGTFINDVRLAYGKATVIEPEDEVKFGLVGVRFEYVPRPVVVEEDVAEQELAGQTTEIGGFEFRSVSSPQAPDTPEAAEASGTEGNFDDTIRAIPAPSQTLPGGELASRVADRLNAEDESKNETTAETVDDGPETRLR